MISAKKRKFCAEYAIDLNATQAAIRAGYSPTSAPTTGCRLLKDVNVKAIIERQSIVQTEAAGLSVQKVLDDLVRLGVAAEADEDWQAAIKARELQGKHLRMFTDKVEHTGEIALATKVVHVHEAALGRIAS